jgi:hypothetical protein
MRVTRLLDLAVLLLLAVVLLMPRPDVTVKAALTVQPERRERVAELQSVLLGKPDAVEPAIELANIFLDGKRPDWALATVGGVLRHHQNDFRLHHLRAIAYADRFESLPAFEASSRALALCEGNPQPPCGEAERSRLHLLKSTLEGIASIDMRKNPALAKEKIFQRLHPTYVPKKKPQSQRPQSEKAQSAPPAQAKPAAPTKVSP